MKQVIKSAGIAMVACAFLFSCAGNPEAGKEKEEKTKKEKKKALTLDQKARNTFKNTTAVFSGSMLLAFNQIFKEQATTFGEAFEGDMDEAAVKELDEKIAGLGEEVLQPLEEMIFVMDSAFDNLAEENLTIYEKMFLHDVMKEGVAITEKYDLPAGFKPLSHDLTDQEIKRYIVKVTSDGEDMEDPVIKTYMELFEWFQKVGEEFNADPEIQSFLEGLRG